MAQICRPAKCVEAVRVSLIGECCGPVTPGQLNGYVMGCIIDPNWTPEIEEGEESLVKDNCGDICLRDDRCDITKRWNLEFKIKNPDEEFIALIGGENRILNDAMTLTVGVQHIARQCSPYLFVELFERTDDCVTGAPIYFRHVFPCTRLVWTGNEREGIFRILQIEGKTNEVLLADVGVGPYGDIPANAIIAPAGTRVDYFWFEDVTVPAVACGAVEVPVGEPAVATAIGYVSPDCETLEITGVNFDLVDQVDFVGTFPESYYDPAGPNNGLNPGTATINTWNATTINITDTQQGGQTVTAVHLYGVGGVPDYGEFDLGDVVIDSCEEECEVCILGTFEHADGNDQASGDGTAEVGADLLAGVSVTAIGDGVNPVVIDVYIPHLQNNNDGSAPYYIGLRDSAVPNVDLMTVTGQLDPDLGFIAIAGNAIVPPYVGSKTFEVYANTSAATTLQINNDNFGAVKSVTTLVAYK